MRTSLAIGSIFGLVALATAANLNDFADAKVEVREDVNEAVGVGIHARAAVTSDDGAAPTLTSTVFDTIVSTIISCAPTVTNCPAHSTTKLTLTVPVSTTAVVIQSSSVSISTSRLTSSSTTTLLVTVTPPPDSTVPSTGASSSLVSASTWSSSLSLAISGLPSTSLAAKSGFSANQTFEATTAGLLSIVWNTGISEISSYTAHSGFTATGTPVVVVFTTTTPIVESSSIFSLSIAKTVLSPLSLVATPLSGSTSTALGVFSSIASSIDSTITSTIINTSTIWPSTITLTTTTITPSAPPAVPVVPSSSISESIASTVTIPLPTGTTTVVISLAPTTTTTTFTPQSEIEASTPVLATPISTPIAVNSAGTNISPAPSSGPICNCPLAPAASSITITVSVTIYQSASLVTVSPLPETESLSPSTSDTLAAVTSCAQDNCLRQFLQSPTPILAFCSTFTTNANTAATSFPPYVSMCTNGPVQLSSACSCVVGAVSFGAAAGPSTIFVTHSFLPTTATIYTTLSGSGSASVPGPSTATVTASFPPTTATIYTTLTSSSAINSTSPSASTSLMPDMPWMTYSSSPSSPPYTNISTENGEPSTSTTTSTTFIVPSSSLTASATTSSFSGEAVKEAGAFKLAFVVGVAGFVGLVGEL